MQQFLEMKKNAVPTGYKNFYNKLWKQFRYFSRHVCAVQDSSVSATEMHTWKRNKLRECTWTSILIFCFV